MSVFFGNKPYVHSLVNTAIETMEHLHLIDRDPTQKLLSMDKSIGTVARVVARFSIAFFVYPRVSTPLSLVTLGVGVIHLGIGLKEGLRTTQKPHENPEKWREIGHDVQLGFVNILTAGYDFSIGYILKTNNIGVFAALGFALLPSIAANYHASVFKKPVIDKTPLEQAADLFKDVKVDETVIKPIEGAEPKPEQTKELPKKDDAHLKYLPYLDPACHIYAFAKKLTLECMPSAEAPKPDEPVLNILSRGYGTLRRLLSRQTADAPPAQKTSEDHPEK